MTRDDRVIEELNAEVGRLEAELLEAGQRVAITFGGRAVQLALPMDGAPLSERVLGAIRDVFKAQGLRTWAALQVALSEDQRTGRARWTLDRHLEAIGMSPKRRRDPVQRRKEAELVRAFTRMELVITAGERVRDRRPLFSVLNSTERLDDDEAWTTEAIDLEINPLLYRGVRKDSGKIGTNWYPVAPQIARIDLSRFAPAKDRTIGKAPIIEHHPRFAVRTGADLRELRAALGLTQAELAEQLGVSRRTIARAEGAPDKDVSRRVRQAVNDLR